MANPSALILVFILACLVIYTFASFRFLKGGIEKELPQPLKLKDWIKVNAYVSFFLCSLFFINSISVLVSTNAVLMKFIDEFLEDHPISIESHYKNWVYVLTQSGIVYIFVDETTSYFSKIDATNVKIEFGGGIIQIFLDEPGEFLYLLTSNNRILKYSAVGTFICEVTFFISYFLGFLLLFASLFRTTSCCSA